MRTEPLFGATAVGAVIIVVYSVISTIVTLDSPELQGLGTGVTCLVSSAVAILVGLIYGRLHSRDGALSVGAGVKGGAASGALVFFINGIVTVILGLVLASQIVDAAVTVREADGGIPVDPGIFNAILPLAFVSVACAGIVLGAIFGAVGGAIGGAIFGQKDVPA